MPTIGAVRVVRIVARASVRGSTSARVYLSNFEHVFFNLAVWIDMVQVSVVQVIHVVAMQNARVFAIWAVLVVVIGM